MTAHIVAERLGGQHVLKRVVESDFERLERKFFMQRVVVVQMITGSLGMFSDELRERYDPRTNRAIGAHITLAGPCNTSTPIMMIRRLVETAAREIAPFELEVGPVQSFLPESNTIYLAVSPSAALMALNARLLNVLSWKEPYSYVPHITITEYLDRARTEAVVEELRSLQVRGRVLIERLSVLVKSSQDTWVERVNVPIGDE